MAELQFIPNELPRNPTPLVSLDIEIFRMNPTRLHRPSGKFACISIGMEDGRTYQLYDEKQLAPAFDLIKDSMWVFQNGQFDIRHLRRWTAVPQRKIWDIMLVDQGLYGGYYQGFNLQDLTIRYLHEPMDKAVREEFGIMDEMTPLMKKYAAKDAFNTIRIAQAQQRCIQEDGEDNCFYWECDEPSMWAMLDMGPVHVDVDAWIQHADDMEVKATELLKILPVNPNSYVKFRELLANQYHIRVANTEEDTLQEVIDKYDSDPHTPPMIRQGLEVCKLALEYRGLKKAASTYGRKWIEANVENGNEVWTNYKINGAETSRMAASEPNMQNIPATKMPEYRDFIVTGYKDGTLDLGDVMQQEPRIIGFLSQDKKMLEAIFAGISTHIMVGRELFDNPNFSKADPNYHLAKTINLGLEYGLSKYGLSRKMRISEDDAERFINTYFAKFPGVRAYVDKYTQRGMAVGYVRNTMGRRIFLNPYSQSAKNNCINGPVQSTAAEQTKLTLGFLHRELPNAGLPFAVNLLVHDEIDSDLPVSDPEFVKRYQEVEDAAWKYAGERTIPGIPVVVEHFTGHAWSAKK